AEMPDNAQVRVKPPGKRGRPVGDKKIAAAENHGQQNVEQGKPVPPADHLGDFFTVALTMSHHKMSSCSLVRVIVVNGRLQRLSKRAGDSLTLGRRDAG